MKVQYEIYSRNIRVLEEYLPGNYDGSLVKMMILILLYLYVQFVHKIQMMKDHSMGLRLFRVGILPFLICFRQFINNLDLIFRPFRCF